MAGQSGRVLWGWYAALTALAFGCAYLVALLDAEITPNLTANASVGYIKAEFDEYKALDLTASPPVTRDFAGSRVFQNTPEWTGAANLTYTMELGDHGRLAFTPSVSYRDKFYMFEIPSALDQSAYWLVDAIKNRYLKNPGPLVQA